MANPLTYLHTMKAKFLINQMRTNISIYDLKENVINHRSHNDLDACQHNKTKHENTINILNNISTWATIFFYSLTQNVQSAVG